MKTYTGSCQCQTVRYEVDMEAPQEALTCNCSRCGRLGWRLAFVGQNQFRLLSGEENLTTYLFGKESIKHQFCTTCGIESFALGIAEPTVAINLNCLEDLDARALIENHFSGKDI